MPKREIDARVSHEPGSAGDLIHEAVKVTKTRQELAQRCGISRDYLRRIENGDRTMSYTLQVTLERIAAGE